MSLIEAIQQESQEAHAKALDVYRETLQRDADPKPGDAKKLREAMATLGYGPDRLAADLATLRQAVSLEREAAGFTPELDEQHNAAWALLTSHNAESERIAAEREAERVHLNVEADRLSNRRDAARNAASKLTELKAANAALFGLQPQPKAEPDLVSHASGFAILPSPLETESEKANRRPVPFAPYSSPSPVPTSAERQALGQ
jgi:hypothetical protein